MKKHPMAMILAHADKHDQVRRKALLQTQGGQAIDSDPNSNSRTCACPANFLLAAAERKTKTPGMPKGTPERRPTELGTSWRSRDRPGMNAKMMNSSTALGRAPALQARQEKISTYPRFSSVGPLVLWLCGLAASPTAVANPSSRPRITNPLQPWVTRPFWRAFRCSVARSVGTAAPLAAPFMRKGVRFCEGCCGARCRGATQIHSWLCVAALVPPPDLLHGASLSLLLSQRERKKRLQSFLRTKQGRRLPIL